MVIVVGVLYALFCGRWVLFLLSLTPITLLSVVRANVVRGPVPSLMVMSQCLCESSLRYLRTMFLSSTMVFCVCSSAFGSAVERFCCMWAPFLPSLSINQIRVYTSRLLSIVEQEVRCI